MPQREEAPFCRLCETEHHEDDLCKGPDGERYDMRIRVGGMHNIHRQPLENTSLASA